MVHRVSTAVLSFVVGVAALMPASFSSSPCLPCAPEDLFHILLLLRLRVDARSTLTYSSTDIEKLLYACERSCRGLRVRA